MSKPSGSALNAGSTALSTSDASHVVRVRTPACTVEAVTARSTRPHDQRAVQAHRRLAPGVAGALVQVGARPRLAVNVASPWPPTAARSDRDRRHAGSSNETEWPAGRSLVHVDRDRVADVDLEHRPGSVACRARSLQSPTCTKPQIGTTALRAASRVPAWRTGRSSRPRGARRSSTTPNAGCRGHEREQSQRSVLLASPHQSLLCLSRSWRVVDELHEVAPGRERASGGAVQRWVWTSIRTWPLYAPVPM